MSVFLWILGGFVLILSVILLAKIDVNLIFKEKVFDCKIKMLGFKINISNEETNTVKKRKDKKPKKAKEYPSKNNDNVNADDKQNDKISFREQIHSIQVLIYKYRTVLERVMMYLSKRLKITKLVIRILFGSGDAAVTGIETGVLWSAAGSIIAILSNYLTVEPADIQIIPDFNKKTFEYYGESIIQTRLAHIIIAGVLGVSAYSKYNKN